MRAKHPIIALAIVGIAACGGGGNEAADQGETTAGKVTDETVAASAPATAAADAGGAVLQTQETNASGLVAELTEATRKEGVLTVKVRFRNTGTAEVYNNFETNHGGYQLFYVTAGEQKYFVLKDAEDAPLAPVYLTVNLDPGATMTWWAKFPAPPATETTFDLIMPDVTPFEDVPITDR